MIWKGARAYPNVYNICRPQPTAGGTRGVLNVKHRKEKTESRGKSQKLEQKAGKQKAQGQETRSKKTGNTRNPETGDNVV